ncbi:KIZ protein, partial [Nyctiprogne leucopyga]|nr:KIZ protein [Nyctiprogne leucopyga]
SEAKRLELERKLMEYRKSDAHLMKLKYMKLKKYLREIEERQKGALLRNQTFLKEFNEFEAHMKTSSSEMIQKMEARYGREIKSLLSLQEGTLSAEGDKQEEEYNKQMLWVGRQAGIGTGAAMPRGLCHPQRSLAEDTRSSVVRRRKPTKCGKETGHLGGILGHCQSMQGCNKELNLERDVKDNEKGFFKYLSSKRKTKENVGLLLNERVAQHLTHLCALHHLKDLVQRARSTDLESDASVMGAVRHRDLSASKEDSEQLLSSASDLEPATPEEECHGEKSQVCWELGKDPHTVEGPALQPPNPPVAQEESSVSSAPDGFCNRAGSLKEDDLEACEAVVLHQLQALSQSVLNGCLLPDKTLDAKDQQWDLDMLQTCLSNHALFLKKHQVQLTEEVAEMFESLLVSNKKVQDGQALPVLREVLPEECGDRSSIQSNESSYSLPSIPNDDSGEIKQAKHAPRLADAGEQGWDIGDNSSQAKESQDTNSETSSSLNERSPPFSR